jgi:hypothetical protein
MALYKNLTADSSAEDIASAYKEFTGTAGGDTQAAQTEAINYLTGIGIGADKINAAYKSFTTPKPVVTTAKPAAKFRTKKENEGSIPYMSEYIASNPAATAEDISSVVSSFGSTYDPVTGLVSNQQGSFTFGAPGVTTEPQKESVDSGLDVALRSIRNQSNLKSGDLAQASGQIYDQRRALYDAIAANAEQPFSYEQFNLQNPIEKTLDYQLLQMGVPGRQAATKEQLKQAHTAIYGAESTARLDAAGGFNLNKYGTSLPLYQYLNQSSAPEEIAQAYSQFASKSGGNTAANQKEAVAYLKNLGFSDAEIQRAYEAYESQLPARIGAQEENLQEEILQEAEIDPYIYAYEYGVANDDFSGLLGLLKQTPDSAELISKYNLTPEQINQIEFGTGFDLDQSGGYGAGKVGNDWDYNKYLDELREGNTDNALNMFKSIDPMGAKRLENMYQELLKQQTVTGDNWAAGNLGSKDAAAMDFALRLMENDLDSIYDLGQRTVEKVVDGYNGPEVQQDIEYFNKNTGEALPDWNRVASGNKLNYRINFAEDGTPIPYTTPKQSDWMGFREGFLKPAVSLVALANPALAPYVAAGNALNAASKGDWGSAIVSGLTAAVGFKGDLGLSASTVDTLSKAKTGAQVLNAIDKGNPVALATALMQTDTGKELMGQDMGGGIKLGDVVNTAKVAQLVNTGNYAEALATVGQMANSPNLKLSASAVNLATAIKSGDPFKIITAAGQMDRAVKSADTPAKKSEAETLKSAGLEEDVNLPSGIQLASLDGESPFQAEVGGPPIFAEDPRAAGIRPPAGYRVLSGSEQQDRLVSEGVGDAPSKYETVRPEGSYYDRTLNAWLAPSGEFEAAMDVEDFSKYFGASSLSDSDIADIYQGVQAGDVTADDLYWLTGQSGKQLSTADIQEIVSGISRPSAGPVTDMGEMVITAPRPPAADMGEMFITGEREPKTDMGEMVITAPREPEPVDLTPEAEFPELVVTAPREPAPVAPAPAAPSVPAKPAKPAAPKAPTVPPKLVQQVAQQLGVPATSQIAIDVAEALYGTMDYLDIGEEFKPSERKAKPAATQKQQQQTKMAQGGYLDAALAEEMSVDELLNLLR